VGGWARHRAGSGERKGLGGRSWATCSGVDGSDYQSIQSGTCLMRNVCYDKGKARSSAGPIQLTVPSHSPLQLPAQCSCAGRPGELDFLQQPTDPRDSIAVRSIRRLRSAGSHPTHHTLGFHPIPSVPTHSRLPRAPTETWCAGATDWPSRPIDPHWCRSPSMANGVHAFGHSSYCMLCVMTHVMLYVVLGGLAELSLKPSIGNLGAIPFKLYSEDDDAPTASDGMVRSHAGLPCAGNAPIYAVQHCAAWCNVVQHNTM
jgi:hypothetical protein